MRLRPSSFMASAAYGSLPDCAIDKGLSRPQIVVAEHQEFFSHKGAKRMRQLIRKADRKAAMNVKPQVSV